MEVEDLEEVEVVTVVEEVVTVVEEVVIVGDVVEEVGVEEVDLLKLKQ